MKLEFNVFYRAFLIIVVLLSVGCSSHANFYDNESSPSNSSPADNRMVIKNASITIEVKKPDVINKELSELLELQKGYLVSSRTDSEGDFYATIKVPSSNLEKTLSLISSMGKETHKSISARDVTDEYRDQEAELNNLKSLRNRLTALLDKAVTVKEVLEVEEQLNRVQTKIDQIEGRLKSLTNRVMYSTIDFRAKKETIYGPVGYLGKGIWWLIEKLFVIQ